MIPKGFPHHPNHFSAKIGPITPRFEPILWHAWWNLAVFWLYHAQKTVFSSRKKLIPKASQNMQKASHIIKVPQCPFPNHIFTAVHTRFTRILACACIFRLGLYMDLHGAGLRNNFWRSKKRKIFDIFVLAQIGSKRHPTSSTSLFSPKIDHFYPIGAHFEACIVSFSCVLHTPCSEKRHFLEEK